MAQKKAKHSLKCRFITLEGIDGTGKTTLAKEVARRLRKTGLSVKLTAEPTDTWLGKNVKRGFNSKVDGLTETFLFLADRSDHSKQIERWLDGGTDIVICDRYHDSTCAYQGAILGKRQKKFARQNESVLAWLLSFEGLFLKPDITFLLVLEPRLSLARLSGRSSMTKFEKEAFLGRVQEVYLKIAERNNRIIALDASNAVGALADRIVRRIL